MNAHAIFHGYRMPLFGEPSHAIRALAAPPPMPEMPKDDGSTRTPWLDKWSFVSEGKRVTIAVETYVAGKREVLDARAFIERLHAMPADAEFKVSVAVVDVAAT